MHEHFAPTMDAALARIDAVRPDAYARSRNALNGAVSGLSPYLTHGFVNLRVVFDGVSQRHALSMQDKFAFELGWRAYFRHVWNELGDGILVSRHEGPLPDAAYARTVPEDIRMGATGVPVIDEAVRTLYTTGWLHNHARMWLASYVVHLRKVHWRAGADWLYAHLLDGDLASNHLSWQWVAGTASRKPYLFNADNVARYAPASWHSPGSVVDQSYEALERWSRDATQVAAPAAQPTRGASIDRVPHEPACLHHPPGDLALHAPRSEDVAGRDVWLVHPWNLGPVPSSLAADVLVLGVMVDDFHRAWPWSERRWRFVGTRMAALTAHRWHGSAEAVGRALLAARSVQSLHNPHVHGWLPGWARCGEEPTPFKPVVGRTGSFSSWWTHASRRGTEPRT